MGPRSRFLNSLVLGTARQRCRKCREGGPASEVKWTLSGGPRCRNLRGCFWKFDETIMPCAALEALSFTEVCVNSCPDQLGSGVRRLSRGLVGFSSGSSRFLPVLASCRIWRTLILGMSPSPCKFGFCMFWPVLRGPVPLSPGTQRSFTRSSPATWYEVRRRSATCLFGVTSRTSSFLGFGFQWAK